MTNTLAYFVAKITVVVKGALLANIKLGWEGLTRRDKYLSLLSTLVNYRCKRFDDIGPRVQCLKVMAYFKILIQLLLTRFVSTSSSAS